MDVTHLLLAILLVCLCFLTACSHLAPEEKPRDDRSLKSNSSVNLRDSPSVSIMRPSGISPLPSLRGHFAPSPRLQVSSQDNKNLMATKQEIQKDHYKRGGKEEIFREKGFSEEGGAAPGPTDDSSVVTCDSCRQLAPTYSNPCTSCKCRFFCSSSSSHKLNRNCLERSLPAPCGAQLSVGSSPATLGTLRDWLCLGCVAF